MKKDLKLRDLAFFKELAVRVLLYTGTLIGTPEDNRTKGNLFVQKFNVPVRRNVSVESPYANQDGSALGREEEIRVQSVHLVRHKDSQQIFAMKKIAKQNLNTPQSVEWAYLERDIQIFADCPFVVPCSAPSQLDLTCVWSWSILMITPAGHIKVTDFGLSKVGLMIPKTNNVKESAEDIAREYQDRKLCGTPCYIAPEVILKEGYGRPVDWWAMGIILHEFLLGSIPFDGDTVTELYKMVLFGGAFQIKDHPFLNDLDFDNLLSQKPEYVPQLLSDMDTSCFINHSDMNKHLVSEDEGTSENNDSLDFQNYTSSSEKLCKLCTTTTSMVNIEDPKTPPEQKESVPVSDRDNVITILPSSPSLSGSIFRRILSSCRRGLSRAARVFACCHCCPKTI
ncbi:unnamed protein product [Ranitomeya imitator]|uniref:non-specific serine/threonine protein kinase n=1 Tax=Ranitomeya imitator TaxID=111125 RepID=A0ABN9M3F8_9NEOB|nr:unnamed protein product [Ranitomeya imitator]